MSKKAQKAYSLVDYVAWRNKRFDLDEGTSKRLLEAAKKNPLGFMKRELDWTLYYFPDEGRRARDVARQSERSAIGLLSIIARDLANVTYNPEPDEVVNSEKLRAISRQLNVVTGLLLYKHFAKLLSDGEGILHKP